MRMGYFSLLLLSSTLLTAPSCMGSSGGSTSGGTSVVSDNAAALAPLSLDMSSSSSLDVKDKKEENTTKSDDVTKKTPAVKEEDPVKKGAPLSTKISKSTAPGMDTIESSLESAYVNNTDLAASVSRVNQADERIVQAKAGYRPKVDGTLSVGASSTLNYGDSVKLAGSRSSPRTESNPTTQAGVQVRQNIYAGGSTVAGVKGAENTVLSARADLMANEQNIFFQVIQAFLEIMTTQAEISQYEGNVKALGATLDATQQRLIAGEDTRTSVAQAEAQLAEGQAQLEDARARLEAQYATYQKLTGRRAKNIVKPVIGKNLPGTLEQAIQIAMENNPEVIKAKFDEATAKYEVDRIGGGLLPQLDVQVSTTHSDAINRTRYASGLNLRTKDRSTVTSGTLTLSVPNYEQGSTRSQKRAAHEVSAERRISVETARRRIQESLATFWQNHLAAKANIEFFKTQVKAREISLDGTQQEMLVGTKLILDVLNAQRDLLIAKLNLIRAERTFYLEYFRILGAMGWLTSKQMKLKVHYYEPKIHYDETKGRI